MELTVEVTVSGVIRSLKKRLIDYRDREREIDNQIERIENMEAKITGLHSPEITDMPKAQNPAQDRIGIMVVNKLEMERNVRELIKLQESERKWIQGLIEHVNCADERACIQMRYIDVESWSKVSAMLFGYKDDYYERRDSYLRRTTKLHGRAIRKMAEYLLSEKN